MISYPPPTGQQAMEAVSDVFVQLTGAKNVKELAWDAVCIEAFAVSQGISLASTQHAAPHADPVSHAIALADPQKLTLGNILGIIQKLWPVLQQVIGTIGA